MYLNLRVNAVAKFMSMGSPSLPNIIFSVRVLLSEVSRVIFSLSFAPNSLLSSNFFSIMDLEASLILRPPFRIIRAMLGPSCENAVGLFGALVVGVSVVVVGVSVVVVAGVTFVVTITMDTIAIIIIIIKHKDEVAMIFKELILREVVVCRVDS